MKKSIITGSTLVLALAFFVGSAMAASAKFSATVDDPTLRDMVVTDGEECAETITVPVENVPKNWDVLFGVSLQTGLYTQTRAKSKTGIEDTSTAITSIKVRLNLYDEENNLVTGKISPSEVVYDSRTQSLSAVFMGLIEDLCEDTKDVSWDSSTDSCVETCYADTCEGDVIDCSETNAVSCSDGALSLYCECGTILEEEVELVLDTMGSHHFNFVGKDLDTGRYTAKVEICKLTDIDVDQGSAEAKVGVGPSSLTAELVRATKTGINFIDSAPAQN